MRAVLRLVYLDDTEYWAEEVVRSTGRIAGCYLYDRHLQTYCCEMTPSYALHLVGYRPEQAVSEAVQQVLWEATAFGEVHYRHCRYVDSFRRIRHRADGCALDNLFVPGRLPCTLAMPGRWPHAHDAAIMAALKTLSLYNDSTP